MAQKSKSRRKRANARAKNSNPKPTMEASNTHEGEGQSGAPVRSEDTATAQAAVQDTANAAANVSAAPLDSIEPVGPPESAQVSSPAVPPEGNGRRSEDTDTLEDTANAAANVSNVSAAPLDSIEPVAPPESAQVSSPAVPPEGNGRRLRSRQTTTEEDEQEVAEFFTTEDFYSRWVPSSGSASNEVMGAATVLMMFQHDPNLSVSVQREFRPRRNRARRNRRS